MYFTKENEYSLAKKFITRKNKKRKKATVAEQIVCME